MTYAVPFAIAFLTAFDGLCRWLRRFDVDVYEGDIPPQGWINWGSIRQWRSERVLERYLMVRFPSYKWQIGRAHV